MPVLCIVCNKRAYSSYCVLHKPRKKIASRGKHYNKWQQTRKEFIQKNPDRICVVCGSEASDIDHVKTRGSHPDLRYVLSNLQWLCRSCHQKKHN